MINYLSPFKSQALKEGNNIAYTVPSLTVSQVRALTFHNTTGNAVSIEVYVSANLDIALSQRLVKKTLAQNASYLCPEVINHVLTEGMAITLVGLGVNAMLSVMEQSR